MSESEKDLAERYIYEVVRRLPKEQRDEIRMELLGLISDMAEEGRTMEDILMELGDPKEFARRYRGENQCLIGHEYYDNYIWVMKIVLICVMASVVISAFINTLLDSHFAFNHMLSGSIDFFAELISEIISDTVISAAAAIGIVTVVFALLERGKVKIEIQERKKWSVENLKEAVKEEKQHKAAEKEKFYWTPGQLKPVPDKRSIISRGDCVAGIIFAVIFMAILCFIPELLGYFVMKNDSIVKIIPVFNMSVWHTVLPLLIISMIVSLTDEIIKLVYGRYCRPVVVSCVICNAVSAALAVIILKALPVWNPEFASDIAEATGKTVFADADLLKYWGTDMISNIILAVIFIIIAVDIGTTIYKTIKYEIREN